MVVIGLLGAVGIVWFYNDIEGMLTRVDVRVSAASGGAMNVLVIGSDSREGLTGDDVVRFGRVGGRRADTIILAQVVPGEQRATLVHFPRDLWVELPGRERGKINASYQYGPQDVIDTVQGVTGVEVNHYFEVDMQGFRRMVDAIGGIEICTERKLVDKLAGLNLPAGHQKLDGQEALAFVRARHATPDGDFGRISRQQQFLRAVVQKVGHPSVLGRPDRVKQLGAAFAQNVTVDPQFDLIDMLRLAVDVKRVGVDQIATFSVPGRITNIRGQSVVVMDERPAQRLFGALQDVRDPAKAFAPHVALEDASGRGLLDEVTQQMEARGFVITRKETLGQVQQRTVVTYPRSMDEEGRQVADSIPDARRLNSGNEVTVVIGSNFHGLTEQAPPPGGPPPPAGICAER